jgi:hypothetical protein
MKAQQAINSLKCYFEKQGNLVKDVRNKYAFHNDLDRTREILRGPDPNEHINLVVPETGIDGFYDFGEMAVNSSMFGQIDEDSEKAIKRLMDEMWTVSHDFEVFGYGLVAHVFHSLSYEYVEEQAGGLRK